MVYRTIRPLLRAQWLAYLLVSTVALASDTAAFLALLSAGLAPAQAGAAGYSFGIVAHWILSSRLVFAPRAAPGGTARMRQKTEFIGSALIGLVLTTLIVGLGDQASTDPRLAKSAAIAVSFTATWLLRSRVVFR
ncbi:GtrA family protein [Novosphingobium sp. APW14]|uniref:GtrA family protein n=1 Tax=Novosphingobium sp. APW14 TaxID=3077237 RepID=UPI0028DE2941|nr:GtrA family protein [Novosphingobium sp. APW14]MDT9012342.1 GtrA family protein [Novosphingobium sp. APW14]